MAERLKLCTSSNGRGEVKAGSVTYPLSQSISSVRFVASMLKVLATFLSLTIFIPLALSVTRQIWATANSLSAPLDERRRDVRRGSE